MGNQALTIWHCSVQDGKSPLDFGSQNSRAWDENKLLLIKPHLLACLLFYPHVQGPGAHDPRVSAETTLGASTVSLILLALVSSNFWKALANLGILNWNSQQSKPRNESKVCPLFSRWGQHGMVEETLGARKNAFVTDFFPSHQFWASRWGIYLRAPVRTRRFYILRTAKLRRACFGNMFFLQKRFRGRWLMTWGGYYLRKWPSNSHSIGKYGNACNQTWLC